MRPGALGRAALVAALLVFPGVASARTEVARVPRFAGPLSIVGGRVFWVERLPARLGSFNTGFVVKTTTAGGAIHDVLTVPPAPHPGYPDAVQLPLLMASGSRVALDVYTEGTVDRYQVGDTSISDELWTMSVGGGPPIMLVRCAPTSATGHGGEGARRLTGLAGDEVAYYDACGSQAPNVVRSFSADGTWSTESLASPDGRVDDLRLAGRFAAWKETAADASTALVVYDRSSRAVAYRLAGAAGALDVQGDGKVLFRTPYPLAWASVDQPYGHQTGLGQIWGFARDAILGARYPGAMVELGLFSLSTGDVQSIVTARRIFTAAFDGEQVAWSQPADLCDQTTIYTQAVSAPPVENSTPAPCPRFPLAILTSRLVLRTSGRIRLRVRCHASQGPCRGVVRVQRRTGGPLGEIPVRLASGSTTALSLPPLRPAARRIVRRLRRLVIDVVASPDDRGRPYAFDARFRRVLVVRP